MKIVQIIHESCGYVYLCAADGKASWKVVCVYLSLSLYPNDAKSQPFLFFILCNKKNRSSRTAMLLQIIVILIFT